MTVQDLIDLLQDLPKDAEVGKIVTRSIGMRDEYEMSSSLLRKWIIKWNLKVVI